VQEVICQAPRTVGTEFWEKVYPAEKRVVLKFDSAPSHEDEDDVFMNCWVKRLYLTIRVDLPP
jgi:hypothetical protein